MSELDPQQAEAASLYSSLSAALSDTSLRPPYVSPDTLEVDPFAKTKAKADMEVWDETLEHCQRLYDRGSGFANLAALEARLLDRRRCLVGQIREEREVSRLRLTPASFRSLNDSGAETGTGQQQSDTSIERLPSLDATASQAAVARSPLPYPSGTTPQGRDQAAAYERLDIIEKEEALTEADRLRFGKLLERISGTLRLVNLRLSALSYFLDRQVVLLEGPKIPPVEATALTEALAVRTRGETIYVAVVYHYLFELNRGINSASDLKRVIDTDLEPRGALTIRISDQPVAVHVSSGRSVYDSVSGQVGHEPKQKGPGRVKFEQFKRRVYLTHRVYCLEHTYEDWLNPVT